MLVQKYNGEHTRKEGRLSGDSI